MPFPTEIWGEVTRPPPDEPDLSAICVQARVGYTVLLKAGDTHFDIWLETAAEVEAYLASMEICWPPSPP